jgi:aconitate hydratase
VPLTFASPGEYDLLKQGAAVEIPDIRTKIANGDELITIIVDGWPIETVLQASERHREILLAGGLLNWGKGE